MDILDFHEQIDMSVGLLKEPQKFQIQFLELHVDFYIVDSTEGDPRAVGSAEILSITLR